MKHRSKNLIAKEGEHSHRFKQFAALEFRSCIVQPYPCAVLKPLRRSIRPLYLEFLNYAGNHFRDSCPLHKGALDRVDKIAQTHEFQVDVKYRLIQADEEARFPHMLTGEACQQLSPTRCKGKTRGKNRGIVLVFNKQNKVEIGMLVKAPVDNGSAASKASNRRSLCRC